MDWLLRRLLGRVFVQHYIFETEDSFDTQPLRIGDLMPEPEPPPDHYNDEESPAPHETAGILRMYRHGMKMPKIMRVLGISREAARDMLALALEDENEAHRTKQSIFDAAILLCEVCGFTMTKSSPTAAFYKCLVCGALHLDKDGATA